MMRSLLENSWMKFGPAGRDSLDLSAEPSALPSTNTEGQRSTNAASIAYIVIATISSILLLLSVFSLLMWHRRRGFRGKLGVANVIALKDLQNLQDPEKSAELLSSLRGGRGLQRPLSEGSDQDDGVFLMVYLPSPYEPTLTRIARAASTSSSKEAPPPPSSPGP